MATSLHTQEHTVLIELLKEHRASAGLRQIDLAQALGVHQSFVSKYELGERRLDLIELRRICAALGIDLPALVKTYEQRLRAPRRPR